MVKKFCCFLFAVLCLGIPLSADRRIVYVSGQTVMINAKYEGVMISGQFEFDVNQQHISSQPTDSIKVGDLIVQVDQKDISTCEMLNQVIASQSTKTTSIPVLVERNGAYVNAQLYLYYDENEHTFKTGFYIKDHINGIGTLTYYDPQNHSYAALGHEITEKATGQVADVVDGTIELGNVVQIDASLVNQPGEKLSRSTHFEIGDIRFNHQFGLYGVYQQTSSYRMMEVGHRHEVQVGPAVMLSVLSGSDVQEIEIEITHVHHQDTPDIKGIEFKIVDESILNETGGIVQGMSGSPIVQNNRIVGAVTHMIPSAPNKGYGIFLDWMLTQSDKIQNNA